MSSISAGTTTTTAFKITSDTTGSLVLKTGASGVTAVDIDAAQVVTIGNIAVTGGTINNTIIGGTTAAAGTFTTLSAASTVTFNGGTANGVAYLNGSKNLTTGSALVFDGTNLGVGTASPAEKLDVQATYAKVGPSTGTQQAAWLASNTGGNIYFGLDNSAGTNFNTGTAYAGVIWRSGANPICFVNNSAERMRLDSSGNLGIGTSSPASILHVQKGNGSIRLDNGDGNYSIWQQTGSDTRFGSQSAIPLTFYTNANERARIGSTGGLSLATSTTVDNNIIINNYCTTGRMYSGGDALFGHNVYADPSARVIKQLNTGYYAAWIRMYYNQGIFFGTSTVAGVAGNTVGDPAGTTNEKMVLTNAGNLGIGTTNPVYPLVVSAAGAQGLEFDATAVSSAPLIQAYNRSGAAYVQLTYSALQHVWQTSGSEKARITNGGSLCINSTSTTYSEKLKVDGGIGGYAVHTVKNDTGSQGHFVFSNPNGAVGSIFTNGTATSYNTSSDRRLKDNIVPAPSASSVVNAIQVISHDWKAGGHTRYGVIAQDLYEVAPEAVKVGDSGEEVKDIWGVDYSKLVPILVKAIQELKAELDALKGSN